MLYHEACGMVTFSIFDHVEYHSKLVAAMKGIASEAVSDHIAEGRRSDRGLVLSEFKHVIAAHDFESPRPCRAGSDFGQ